MTDFPSIKLGKRVPGDYTQGPIAMVQQYIEGVDFDDKEKKEEEEMVDILCENMKDNL